MGSISSIKTWWVLPALLASVAVVSCGGDDDAAASRAAGLLVAAPELVADTAGRQSVRLSVMSPNGATTVTTAPLAADAAAALADGLAPGDLVDWLPDGYAGRATTADDPAATFNVILSKGTSAAAQFDAAKYGPEVTAHDGKPGAMVAAGWVYGKTADTITLGDGRIVTTDQAGRAYAEPIKRYEETYRVAANAKVYRVDTGDYARSVASDFASIPVTADYHYGTTQRQAAYVLFDRNYTDAERAQVVAIWYFTPQSTSDGKPGWDVPTQSPMLADKGVDPVSGQPFIAINATGVTAAPYTRSTEPFEIVPGTMYYVGDNEVAAYLFKADMGTADPADDRVIKVDGGWPNSGYQYWKNMEILGIDPRSVTDLVLTHGHGDHYGTFIEQFRMMDNAGKSMRLWASREEADGIQQDAQGNAWNIAGGLPMSQVELRERITDYFVYDQWYDFGNVQMMIIWSPGHTTGTTNMLFRVKNPADGQFVTFGYHGGYGVGSMGRPTATSGWLRLSFEHGFSYLQQTVDVDYVSPQHTNQYPIVEVYQALKAYNRDPANAGRQLTMLDALNTKVYDAPAVGGEEITSEFANQLEKRRSVVAYATSDAANPNYKSIETSGPFKPGRENGSTVTATLRDGGKIIQGFVGAQNKNPAIPLLADGIAVVPDSFANDPDGFYVQVAIDVDDAYQGFLPEGFEQYSPGLDATITYRGGPIESVHATTTEYLRTVRLDSLAEAQAILATVVPGRQVTISLTPSSQIVVPADVTQTFR